MVQRLHQLATQYRNKEVRRHHRPHSHVHGEAHPFKQGGNRKSCRKNKGPWQRRSYLKRQTDDPSLDRGSFVRCLGQRPGQDYGPLESRIWQLRMRPSNEADIYSSHFQMYVDKLRPAVRVHSLRRHRCWWCC
jgi:hypothetical protein